jgi:Cys-tRNA synthase (O-phospho-L-seryl-tRNA:Cys-tRNA synthase)
VVYHVKRSQCSVVPKPIKVPQLETLAQVRERVDLWERELEKTKHLLVVEVQKARKQLGKNKSYRKARVEGTPEAQELAKKKQKVCIVVLRPLMS